MQSQNFSSRAFDSNYILMPRDPIQESKQILSEQIVQQTLKYCQRKYHAILPNHPQRVELQSILLRVGARTATPVNQVIASVMQQYDILIQLIMQNNLFSLNQQVRQKNSMILQELERLSQFHSQKQNGGALFRIGLPYFVQDEDNAQALEESPFFDATPQISIYSAPLLNFLGIILELSSKAEQKSEEDKITLLQQFKPLINLSYIPTFYQSNSKVRCKFSPIDEALLLQGLQKYSSKQYKQNLIQIQKGYLWDKDLKQIKNKYKNSICSNAILNRVKQWKSNQYSYMTKSEVKSLIKGINWFDKRWKLISRYFINNRTPEFLEAEFKKSDTLLKKRRKHGVEDTYPEHYSHLKQQFLKEESNGRYRIPKQQIYTRLDQPNQVKQIMQRALMNDYPLRSTEPVDHNSNVDFYLNLRDFSNLGFSNSFILRSNNFNNLDFHLDNPMSVKFEQVTNGAIPTPHFKSENLNTDFRLDDSRSRSRLSNRCDSINFINSRLFQQMDQVAKSQSQVALQIPLPRSHTVSTRQTTQATKAPNPPPRGLEGWNIIVESISKQ